LTRNLYRISLGLYWAAVLVAVVGVTVYADTVQIETRTDLYFTIDTDETLVAIYGNSNRSCEEFGADPYLWLYQNDQLIASDDDSNHNNLDNCLSSKIYLTLDAGDYMIRAGWYPDENAEGEPYELQTDLAVSPSTTTSTTTTTTTTTTSTTTSTTTTTTTIPATTSTTSTTSTTTTPPTTSTTTSTTTTTPPTTSTTEVTSTTSTTTTIPTTTSTSSTTTSVVSTTTSTSSTTTTSSSTTTSSTTTSTLIPTTSTTSTVAPSVPDTPPPDAPESEKREFEATVNIYSEPGFDDYIPAGSTVTVSTRRTIVAASVAIGAVPTLAPRRRKR